MCICVLSGKFCINDATGFNRSASKVVDFHPSVIAYLNDSIPACSAPQSRPKRLRPAERGFDQNACFFIVAQEKPE